MAQHRRAGIAGASERARHYDLQPVRQLKESRHAQDRRAVAITSASDVNIFAIPSGTVNYTIRAASDIAVAPSPKAAHPEWAAAYGDRRGLVRNPHVPLRRS